MQLCSTETTALTFDEVSMERSKSFVKALQELKNLRPQLYTAAEYCEKSYLQNQQKQMVLANLKDYAIGALVNAVDHIGTVAYKLTDLYDQQSTDLSFVDFKISCLNQRIVTCQNYIEKEGLIQQQISGTALRHHKHYILPISVSQKAQSGHLYTQAKPRSHPQGTPASKPLSWHLSSESNSPPNGKQNASLDTANAFKMTTQVFQLLEAELDAPVHLPRDSQSVNSFGMRNSTENVKPITAFRSFEKSKREATQPTRSKSVLSVFFTKPKYLK